MPAQPSLLASAEVPVIPGSLVNLQVSAQFVLGPGPLAGGAVSLPQACSLGALRGCRPRPLRPGSPWPVLPPLLHIEAWGAPQLVVLKLARAAESPVGC